MQNLKNLGSQEPESRRLYPAYCFFGSRLLLFQLGIYKPEVIKMPKLTFRLKDGSSVSVDENDVDYNRPMDGFVSIWLADENVIRIWPASQIERIDIKPERVLKVVEAEAA